MQLNIFIAGILTIIIGAIHSILGEILIFRWMRVGGRIVPTIGAPLLKERHIRILWASWHIVTVFAWALAAVMLRLAFPTDSGSFQTFVKHTIIASMLASALLVFFGTRARHPGWLGLATAAVLVWLT